LEDLAKTNRWMDAQTYYHFANALRNTAHEWHSSVVDWDDEELDQPLWSDFKDVFKQEYTVQMNKRTAYPGRVGQPGDEAIRNNKQTAHENHPYHQSNQGELC
jgi:hypothetical protein